MTQHTQGDVMFQAVIVQTVTVILRSLLITACLVAGAFAAEPVPADPVKFQIEEQPLRDALAEFARQSDREILFSTEVVEDKDAPLVVGEYEPEDALELLLADTGLEYSVTPNDTILVAEEKGGPDPGNARTTSTPGRMAQASEERNRNTEEGQARGAFEQRDIPIEEIVVTGTNIKGVRDQFSPVVVRSRNDIDQAGIATVSGVIASLPQNFGGGVAGNLPSTTLSIVGSGAAAANIRGLGNEATLTLINGRRLAPGGLTGNIADISAIPVSAIERVEVLTDGASAIYGADAVAGVVNLILRQDYEGAETRVRYGGSTQGDGEQLIVGQTMGNMWDRGRVLLTYEYASDQPVDSRNRSATSSAATPTDVYPETSRHSVFTSAGMAMTSDLEVSADAYYNFRRSRATTTLARNNVTHDDEAEPETYGFAVGANYNFGDEWYADASLSVAYSDAAETRQDLTATTGAHIRYLTQDSEAETLSGEFRVGGPILRLGGGDLSAVAGVQTRRDEYRGYSADTLGGLFLDVTNQRDVTALFGELYVPLIGESNALAGVNRLALTMAMRYEDYSDVGSSTNPKVGLAYSPFEGLTVRGTYGTSFRAPRLEQIRDVYQGAYLANYIDPDVPSGRSLAIVYFGNRADLDPETSENVTLGIDFEPSFAPGLALRATYFDTDLSDQVVSLFPSVDLTTFNFFDSPLPVIRGVTSVEITDLLSKLATPLVSFVPGANPQDATIFIDTRPINAASTVVQGIDFSISYQFETRVGRMDVFLQGTHLTEFDQKSAPTSPTVSPLDAVGGPLDVRVRGGLSLNSDPWTLSGFVNYAGKYADIVSAGGGTAEVDDWTTFDVSARYNFGRRAADDLATGWSATIAITNAFDSDPPRIAPRGAAQLYSFDQANADALGRFVSVQLTKVW